jgi:signal transduction histidine kinase
MVVDDEDGVRSALFSLLDRSGYRVSSFSSGQEALEHLADDPPAVVITDLKMPGLDGSEFVEHALREEPDTMIVVLTGFGTVESTVELMRKGVYSVLTKPSSVNDILFMVEKALRDHALRQRSRDLEKQLDLSERLAMIGKLAAGVAHELNSPLDGVIRFVKLNLDALPERSEAREFQEEALKGLRRMSSIVTDLLMFSRNLAQEAEEEGVEALLREAAGQVLEAGRPKRVEVGYDLAVPDLTVPRGMFQVFQNLIKNAVDAVPDGGRIELRAGIQDGELFVSVADNGPGVPEEQRDRVFEPFFTTKAMGQGTGLGLSIVARIMERFGGGVMLENGDEGGATFTVFLPTKPPGTTRRRDEDVLRERESIHSVG